MTRLKVNPDSGASAAEPLSGCVPMKGARMVFSLLRGDEEDKRLLLFGLSAGSSVRLTYHAAHLCLSRRGVGVLHQLWNEERARVCERARIHLWRRC